MTDLKELVKAGGFKGELDDSPSIIEAYSHDASLFEIKPKLVVFPKDSQDVESLVKAVAQAKKYDSSLSLTARSAGTDMAGGAINDSIIVDFRKHFTEMGLITRTTGQAQPGVLYRDFEKRTLSHGALMPTFPASRDLASIGGMVANNSGGEKSLEYGKTKDFINELKVIFSDGVERIVKPLTKDELDKVMAKDDFEGVEKLKSHIHQQLIDNRQPDLNYVIVGAGPTGIELAGALPEYIKHIMQLHKLQPRPLHIDLIDSSTRLLAHLPRDTSRMVARQIRKKGIKIYTNQRVEGESANNLTINGKPIQSHTVIWTAGASMNPFFADNNFAMSANHHVSTDVYLAAEDSIFVLGDNANTPYSGMAQTALYDGEFLAANLIRQENGKNMKPYRPKQPITIIPVGEGWAAVIAGKIRLYGWLGWVLRQAADARAFHGYESWNKAIPQWFSYSSVEESCPVCLSAERT